MNWDEYYRSLIARLDAPRQMEEANKRLQEILDQRTREDWALHIRVDPTLLNHVIQCQDVTIYNIKGDESCQ